MTNDVAANLERLRETIASATASAGRNSRDVKLIAVSKTHPIEAVEAAVRADQHCFGESTVQEALTKIPPLQGRGLEWHFIGHLQTNKAKFVPGNFSWLHSLESPKLAQRLSQAAQERKVVINALIEVNVARARDKHGLAPEQLPALLDQLLKQNLSGVELRGLMTIGPHPATESDVRAAFADLRRLRDQMARQFALPRFTELSMGMSADFVPAIKEGATMVRVGTALFGKRDRSA